jgi:hypothetical protein
MDSVFFTKHLMKLALLCVLSLACSLYADIEIKYESNRHTFIRGETAIIQLSVSNNSSKILHKSKLEIDIEGLIKDSVLILAIEPNATRQNTFKINTKLLKPGSYNLHCKLRYAKSKISEDSFPFIIAAPSNPDRMRVWLWPHKKFGEKVWKLDDQALKQLDWYASKGFNSFHPGGGVFENGDFGGFGKEKLALYDYALTRQWDMSIKLLNGYYLDINEPSVKFKTANGMLFNDPFNPTVGKEFRRVNEDIMQAIAEFPAVKMIYFESEYEDYLNVDTPMSARFYPESLPYGSAHKFILPGVIDDNDSGYLNQLYHFKWGDGVVASNQRAIELAKRYRPDIYTFSDPFRLAPIYDRFKGLDAISTWTYVNPDPKFTLYIETLIAAAKPEKQGVIHTTTLLNYPGTIFPKDKGWAVMGPDELIEASWINLSRRPDALALYTGSMCDVFDPNNVEPFQKYAPTFEAFAKFADTVLKPYGPMIGKLDRQKRRVAVLSSNTSRIYSDSPVLLGYYPNYQVYSFYTLLNMIHVPADIIFDETITRFGMADYDVLVLPKCDTLSKSVYEEILRFQRRGGVVIADQYLRAQIPNIIKCDFDFTYRSKISADAIASGKTYARWDDHVKIESTEFKDVNGITAAEDQRLMEKYAQQLKHIFENVYTPEIECSSPTALLNTLEKDGILYLFIINDKRTYGSRLGEYKAMLEKTIPQTVRIRINNWKHAELNVYDMLNKKLLAYSKESDGSCSFDVNLPAPGGKIIALRPDKVKNISIVSPTNINKGECQTISVLLKNDKGSLIRGIQPVYIKIIDPNGTVSHSSDFFACENGILQLDFRAALNDITGKWEINAHDLMTDLTVCREFILKRDDFIK